MAIVGRPDLPIDMEKAGISISVDANGVPYLTTSDGKRITGVRSFSIHVEVQGAVWIDIREVYAAPPDDLG